MKMLMHSNAPFCNTGYGCQTRIFAPRFQAAGHEIAVSCFYGLQGSRLKWNDLLLLPAGHDVWGNDIISAHAAAWFGGKARDGLVLTLMDVWVLNPGVMNRVNWAAWLPIDHDPAPPAVVRSLQQGNGIPIALTRFGQRMLQQAGFDPFYVPHGIDTSVYAPGDKAEAKKRLGIDPDRFLVLMVAANKGNPSRKSFPEAIEAFENFRKRHEEALLFLHTEQTGLAAGVNLPELMKTVGIPPDAAGFCDQYQNMVGYPDEHMSILFNAADVLLQPSMGEGFGIPIIEAQACGTPVIVTDFTAMSELCGSGWKVRGQRMYTAQASWQMVPSMKEIEDALENAYRHRGDADMQREARRFAERYDADKVMSEYWTPVLEQVKQRIQPELKLVSF